MRKWRKMTWVLWAWCALIIFWAAGAGSSANCGNEKGGVFLSASDAQSACEAGTGIGIAIILFIGFVGFVFFSLIWFMTRPKDGPAVANAPTAAPAGFYADPSGNGAERYWNGQAWTDQVRTAASAPPPPPVTA